MKPTEALRPWIQERPPPLTPGRPWVHELDEAPPIPADISQRVAELRALIPDEPPKPPRPKPFVVDRDALKVVPPEVYAAAEEGRRQFQANRRARLDAAK